MGSSRSSWNPFRDVGNVLDKVVTTVGKTVEAVIKNPLPVIETVALSAVGVPPVFASAIVTAANGGTPEQVLKAAAFASIPMAGEAISEATGLSIPVSTALASAGVSVATGSSIEQAVANGVISGAVSGSKPYVQAEINDLVSSPAVADILNRPSVVNALTDATLAAEGTVLHGGTSDQIANSIATSFANSAIKETSEALKPSKDKAATNPNASNAANDSLAASNALTPAETIGSTTLTPAEIIGANPLASVNPRTEPDQPASPLTTADTAVAAQDQNAPTSPLDTANQPSSEAPVELSPVQTSAEPPIESPLSVSTETAPEALPETSPKAPPELASEPSTSPIDTTFKADYSLDSTLTPKPGVDSTTGTGLTVTPETMGASDVGYSPVDYSLTNPSGLTGGTGLQMPTSSNIKAMGGGQGLTADVTNPVTGETGTVGQLGYTATGAIPVSDPAYSKTTAPKSTSTTSSGGSGDSGGSTSNLNKALIGLGVASAASGASQPSPLSNSQLAESYLTTHTINGQELTLPQLKQLYPGVVPELSKLLVDRGMILTPAQQEVKFGDFPQTVPSNSNSDDLSAVALANLGQPSEDYQYAAKGGSMRLPKGHKPEFITGQTGHYAQGRGTGQSDDIPAVLHDGDYVVDADTVAAFGDGSSKAGAGALEQFRRSLPEHHSGGGQPIPAQIADGEYVLPAAFVTSLGHGSNKNGAKLLDAMREKIRAHKRSAPDTKIPPKARSPLQYMNEAMKG